MCFGNYISRQKIVKEIYNQFNFWHIKHFITGVSVVLKGTPSSVAKTSMWAVNSQYAVPSTECLKCKKHRVSQSNEIECSPTSMFLFPHGSMCTWKQRLTAEYKLERVPRVLWDLTSSVMCLPNTLDSPSECIHACQRETCPSLSHFEKLSANFLI